MGKIRLSEVIARIAAPAATVDLQLLQGEHHTFVNEHPFAPNSVKAVEMAKAFIKKHGSAKTSSN